MKCVAPFILVSLAFVPVAGLILPRNPDTTQVAHVDETPPFHAQPPAAPLPTTLNPYNFSDNQPAYVAYVMAARIKPLLYQIPCYCPCKKIEDHRSLLDCFVGTHGVKCAICQKEALFCYRASCKRKSPLEIRQAIARGKAWKLDLHKEAQRAYRQIHAGGVAPD
jgi:hypothetical protein